MGIDEGKKEKAMKPPLELKVARILKDSLTIGDFDNKEPWEERLIEEWVHAVYMRHNEDEKLEISWNQ